MRQALQRIVPLVLLFLAWRLADGPVSFLEDAALMTWNAHFAYMSWRTAISSLRNQLALASLAPNNIHNGYRRVLSGLEV